MLNMNTFSKLNAPIIEIYYRGLLLYYSSLFNRCNLSNTLS